MCCCNGTESKANRSIVKDVVCGMEIDSSEAAGQSLYQGETYYFCALACKRKFDTNPQQFVD